MRILEKRIVTNFPQKLLKK